MQHVDSTGDLVNVADHRDGSPDGSVVVTGTANEGHSRRDIDVLDCAEYIYTHIKLL